MRKRVEHRGVKPLLMGGLACAALAATLVAVGAAFPSPWAAGSGVATSGGYTSASNATVATPATLNADSVEIADPLTTPGIETLSGSVAYAADADKEEKGGKIAEGGLTFTITAVASEGALGTVELTSADKNLAGEVNIPAEVAHPTSGNVYQVTGMRFDAFNNRANITAVAIPASVVSYRFNAVNNGCFAGCSALQSVTVAQGNPSLASQDGVLYAIDEQRNLVSLLAYPQAKTSPQAFTVSETVSTVVSAAFAGNTALKQVVFASGLEGCQAEFNRGANTQFAFCGGIGAKAFANCTALESIQFPSGAELNTLFSSNAQTIAEYAFQNCTSLKSIHIPVLEGAAQKANAYNTFDELNPGSTLTSGTNDTFTSGFAPYWHEVAGPVARAGFGTGVFSGCVNLESITFDAGSTQGAFAYWVGSNALFWGCSNLKSLVFESTQAYWGDVSRSLANAQYENIWAEKSGAIIASPTYYYAVDYYATADAAAAADKAGSTRLARVEYAHGTSTAAIATSADALAGSMADRAMYAETTADGVVPNANEVAQAAGLGSGNWVWKLTGTQNRRAGLTESCQAYLANLNDISMGRLDSAHITALYLACDRNLSEGTVEGTAFDAQRYESDSNYRIEALNGETSPIFSFNRTTGELAEGFSVCAADGTVLDPSAYTVSYQRYNSETKQFESAKLADGSGAYLVTITPTAESGYTGTLQDWIITKNLTGSVSTAYGESPVDTTNAARHPYSQTQTLDFSTAPYSVTVSSGDVVGALVASGYAGLVQGAVNVSTTSTENTFGFSINTSSLADGSANSSVSPISVSRVDSSDSSKEMAPSAFANASFNWFEDRRRPLGASSRKYPWGSTAVLVPATHASALVSASAYAYANKAPVFFTEIDGSVSADTLANLKKFQNVVVMGSESQFSKATYDGLAGSLGAGIGLTRLQGSATAMGSFSEAVATNLVASGKATWKNVAVVDGANPVDAVAALTFTGHEGGVTLITKSVEDAKEALTNLHNNSGIVGTVALYGRNSSNTTALTSSAWDGNAFGAIWEDEASFQNVLANITSTLNKYPDVDDKYNVATGGGTTDGGNKGDTGNNGNNGNKDNNGANKGNTGNKDNGNKNDSGNKNNNGSQSGGNSNADGGNGNGNTDGGANNNTGQEEDTTTPYIEEYTGHIAAYNGQNNAGLVAHVDRNGLVVVESWDSATAAAAASGGAGSDGTDGTAGADGSSDGSALVEDYEATAVALREKDASQSTGEDYSGIEEETPLPVRAGYMGGLLLLCGSVVPLLRRCK